MKKLSRGSILGWAAILLFYGIFCFIVYDGANKVATRNNTDHVEISATISSVDHYTEIDEGFEEDRYKSYVSYDYEGEHYSYVYYDDSHSKPKLGKTVTVLIDPENPGELLPDNTEYGLSLILSPLFLAGLTGLAWWFIREKLKEKEPDDPDIDKRSRRNALGIVASVLATLSLWFYSAKDSLVLLGFSAVALVIVTFFAYRKPKEKTEE